VDAGFLADFTKEDHHAVAPVIWEAPGSGFLLREPSGREVRRQTPDSRRRSWRKFTARLGAGRQPGRQDGIRTITNTSS
jgi:hypothetical protein